MHAWTPLAPSTPLRRFVRRSAVAVLLLVAGCADLAWQKPGVEVATLEEDLQQCSQQGRLDARREEVPQLDSALIFRADPLGRPVVVPNTARDDRYLVERDFTNACMRGKGYVLQKK